MFSQFIFMKSLLFICCVPKSIHSYKVMICYGTKLPALNDPDGNGLFLGPVSSYRYIALGVGE